MLRRLIFMALALCLFASPANAAQGASCADWDSSGPAFFRAARVEDVKRCLAAGADANAHRMGWTVLHSAVTYGAPPEVVAALLDAGARLIPEVRSVVPEPLRMAAYRAANPEVVRVLLAAMAADPPADMRKRLSGALQGAAYSNGNPAVAAALIAAGADPNARDGLGDTALHKAALTNAAPAVVKVLLAAGADIDARGENGVTPLHLAAVEENTLNRSPHVESARVLAPLLAAGADLSARDGNGDTPLLAALARTRRLDREDPGLTKAVRVLLEAGADPDARDRKGRTALHVAARRGGPGMIAVLLDAGADVNAKDERGRTPLAHARLRLNSPGANEKAVHGVIKTLEARGARE